MIKLRQCTCGNCGEEKEIVAFVDGIPWCEDCFLKGLGVDNDG